jgi:hypothetical protein
MRRTIVASLRLLAVIGLGVFLVPGVAGAAAEHVTFGIVPGPANSTSAPADFTFGVTGGATVADSVTILNYSLSPLSLQVYAADAVQSSSGAFGLLLPTQKSVGVGAWVAFSHPRLTVNLPAASSSGATHVTLPFTLHVPDNATPGDHVGAILASLQTIGHSSSGKKIILDQRVGARIYVTVSGATHAGLRVANLSTSVHGGQLPGQHDSLEVSYDVQNTGNVNVSLNQRVSASGLIADHGSVTMKNNPIVLPGATLSEEVTIPGLWPEFVTRVAVHATGSVVTVQGLAETIHATGSSWVLTVPWLSLAILVVLIAVLWWWRRRWHAHPSGSPEVATKVDA